MTSNCSACGGSGLEKFYAANTANQIYGERYCSTCDGKGLLGFERCGSCDGSGIIDEWGRPKTGSTIIRAFVLPCKTCKQ